MTAEEKRKKHADYMREYYRRNPQKNRDHVKKWREENPEKKRATSRRNAVDAYHRDPEKFRARRRDYRAALSEEERQAYDRSGWEYQKRNPQRYLYYNAAYRARTLGLPFTITKDDIEIPDVCPVLGIPIFVAIGNTNGFNPNSASLDRIIPDLGYVPGNIRVISHLANTIKRDLTDPAPFRAIADYIERETARIRSELG